MAQRTVPVTLSKPPSNQLQLHVGRYARHLVAATPFVAGSAVDAIRKVNVLAADAFPASAQAEIFLASYTELMCGVIHRSRG